MGLRYSTYLDPNDEIESIFSTNYKGKGFGESCARFGSINNSGAVFSMVQPRASSNLFSTEEGESNNNTHDEDDDDDDDDEEEDANMEDSEDEYTIYSRASRTPQSPSELSSHQVFLISRGIYSESAYNRSELFTKPTSSGFSSRTIPFYKTNPNYNKNGKAITYGCKDCLTHLSSSNLIISDKYHGVTGDALLIDKVVNILLGPAEVKRMTTGCYRVCDIKCHQCLKLLGWKYLKSYEFEHKFKENRYILEINNIRQVR